MMRRSMLVLAAALGAAARRSAAAGPLPRLFQAGQPGCACPGRSDICSTPLPTTALNPNGYGSNGPSPVAKDPPLDCFYVYPTVSRDQGMNSDLMPDSDETARGRRPSSRASPRCAGRSRRSIAR